MRTLKRLRIPSLLKIALAVITVSGVSLFLMVDRLEKPFIQDLRLPINDGHRFTNDAENNPRFVRERKERQDDDFQDDDHFFEKFIDGRTKSSQKDAPASQAPYQHKSKLTTRKRSSKSKGIYHGNKMISQGGEGLFHQNMNISRSDSQRRLPNYHRAFSEDNRQLPDTQSNSQRPPATTKLTRQFNEKAEKIKESRFDSEEERGDELQSRTNNLGKTNFQESKPFESNFEYQRRNTTKNPYLSERKSNIAAIANHDPIGNSSKLKEYPEMNRVRPSWLSSYDAQVKNLGMKTRSLDVKDVSLNLHIKTDSHLKEYSNNPERIRDGPRDFEKLPKESSKKFKPAAQQNSSKVISKKRGDSEPRVTNNFRNSDQSQKEISVEAKSSLKPHSSKLAFHYQGKTVSLKVANEHRNSDQFPKSSSKRMKSSAEQQPGKVGSNYQGSSKARGVDNIRNYDHFPKAPTKKRKSLLLFGDDRSGTTFVTKMFAADPQMFTVYEPLWVTKQWFKDVGTYDLGFQKRVVLDVVNGLLSCQFTSSVAATTFLKNTTTPWVGRGVFAQNVFRTSPFKNKTQSGVVYYPELSRHPKFAEDVCLNSFNHSVVKVGQVRVPRDTISVFIPQVFKENPDTDIRVIQIVRDPRGSINSRIRSGWMSDFTFAGFPITVKSVCDKITANIKFGRNSAQQNEWLKERYMEITYKEITTMPVTTAKKIYKFAGFEMRDSVVDWIVSSTNPDEEQLAQAIRNPYSHIRDSSNNYLKWRKESPIKRVRVIEKRCKELLDLLRLDPVADEMETLCSG